MARFISNYVLLNDGAVMNNHIVTIDDNGCLTSVVPFTSELAYTKYVSKPILVCVSTYAETVKELFNQCGDLGSFSDSLIERRFSRAVNGDAVTLFALDFESKSISMIR